MYLLQQAEEKTEESAGGNESAGLHEEGDQVVDMDFWHQFKILVSRLKIVFNIAYAYSFALSLILLTALTAGYLLELCGIFAFDPGNQGEQWLVGGLSEESSARRLVDLQFLGMPFHLCWVALLWFEIYRLLKDCFQYPVLNRARANSVACMYILHRKELPEFLTPWRIEIAGIVAFSGSFLLYVASWNCSSFVSFEFAILALVKVHATTIKRAHLFFDLALLFIFIAPSLNAICYLWCSNPWSFTDLLITCIHGNISFTASFTTLYVVMNAANSLNGFSRDDTNEMVHKQLFREQVTTITFMMLYEDEEQLDKQQKFMTEFCDKLDKEHQLDEQARVARQEKNEQRGFSSIDRYRLPSLAAFSWMFNLSYVAMVRLFGVSQEILMVWDAFVLLGSVGIAVLLHELERRNCNGKEYEPWPLFRSFLPANPQQSRHTRWDWFALSFIAWSPSAAGASVEFHLQSGSFNLVATKCVLLLGSFVMCVHAFSRAAGKFNSGVKFPSAYHGFLSLLSFLSICIFIVALLNAAIALSNTSKKPIMTVSIGNSSWINIERREPAYPVCSMPFGDPVAPLSIIDLGVLSSYAYIENSTNHVTLLEDSFSDFQQLYMNNYYDFPRVVATYYRPKQFPDSPGTLVVAVKGTSTPLDALMDVSLYGGITILQMLNLVLPLLDILPNVGIADFLVLLRKPFRLEDLIFDRMKRKIQDAVNRAKLESGNLKEPYVVLTGHSLGGGIASIVGQRMHYQTAVFSSPGTHFQRYRFSDTMEAAFRTVVNIVPQTDRVAMVDRHDEVAQFISCAQSSGFLTGTKECHLITSTICELWRVCGDVNRGSERDFSHGCSTGDYFKYAGKFQFSDGD